MSDVVVTHVRTGTWLIEDIGVDVPNGVIITIPADRALHSKDLWRAIAQRVLFRFHPGSIHKGAPLPTAQESLPKLPETTSYNAPEVLVRALNEHGEFLREALDMRDISIHSVLMAQQKAIEGVQGTLQEIKALLLERPVATTVVLRHGDRPPGQQQAAVVTETPMFIPSVIKPTDVQDASISVQTDAQEGSSVAGAASALRKLKQSGGQ
jgi:hypothetical protein